MARFFLILVLSVVTFPTCRADADPIPILGYDITNAPVSGTGSWAHTYTGTITPTSVFDLNEVLATYTGGGGTLNDGVIGHSVTDTQLLDSRVDLVITLFLASPAALHAIDLFGGNIPANSLPGNLNGDVQVTVNGISTRVPTLPFGHQLADRTQPVNDRLLLTGTPLEGLLTDRIVLSEFHAQDRFSLTEISINGPNPLPEPATLMLVIGGLGAAAARKRRRGAAI